VAHEAEPTDGGPGQKRTPARPLSAANEGDDEVDHNDSSHKGN